MFEHKQIINSKIAIYKKYKEKFIFFIRKKLKIVKNYINLYLIKNKN